MGSGTSGGSGQRKKKYVCIRGVEEIVAVRTFRSRLPVRRVRHMDRRGQEVQNNFLTDHIIKFLSGSPVRPSRRALRASCTGTVVVHRIP